MIHENASIIKAKDVMHKGIVSIDGMATAREAAAKMRSEKLSYLLVDKRNDDDAWGIVAVHDFIEKVIIPGRSSSNVHVYEIMTKPIITVPADMDIRYVARMIYRAGIRRTAVEEGGELIGTITLSSLILKNKLF